MIKAVPMEKAVIIEDSMKINKFDRIFMRMNKQKDEIKKAKTK